MAKDLRLFVSIFLSFFVLVIPSAPAYSDYDKSTQLIVLNPTAPLPKQSPVSRLGNSYHNSRFSEGPGLTALRLAS